MPYLGVCYVNNPKKGGGGTASALALDLTTLFELILPLQISPIPNQPPCVTFHLIVVPSRGPGQSPVLPFARCVGSLRSVGRCGGALAGVVSAFAEPSSWCVGTVLDVAGCAVCASAGPNSWRIGGCAGCCRGRLTVFAVHVPLSTGRPWPALLCFCVHEAQVPCSSTRCPGRPPCVPVIVSQLRPEVAHPLLGCGAGGGGGGGGSTPKPQRRSNPLLGGNPAVMEGGGGREGEEGATEMDPPRHLGSPAGGRATGVRLQPLWKDQSPAAWCRARRLHAHSCSKG